MISVFVPIHSLVYKEADLIVLAIDRERKT
jgi:hypothetical protein